MTDQPDAFAEQSARYHDFVDSTQRWLGKRADRYHWFYNGSRIALVVLSVSISSLSMGLLGEKAKGATPFVALTIAIVAALDGLLKPGDNWRHFRSYQLGLMRLRRVWEVKNIALAELEPNADKRRQKAVDLHRQFVFDVEALLEQESKLFFEHQIQQLKQKAE